MRGFVNERHRNAGGRVTENMIRTQPTRPKGRPESSHRPTTWHHEDAPDGANQVVLLVLR